MKWFKRCWLSIIRRPSKSVMLFSICLGMMTLLAGSLGIISTSESIKSEIEIGLGSDATITNELYPWNYSNEEIYDTIDAYTDIMDELVKDERVAYGEYHITTPGIYKDFESLDYSLYSTNIVESKDFKDDVNQLVTTKDNRYFTEEEIENGEMVIMTSYALRGEEESLGGFTQSGLCKLNNEVTLTIPLKYEYFEKEDGTTEYYVIGYDFKVKVIGIFNNKNDEPIIYVPQKTFDKVLQNANEYAKDIGIEKPINLMIGYTGFRLKDGKSLDSFDEDAKKMISTIPNSEAFKYLSSNDSYERNAGPVENLEAIAKFIFIAALVCTVIIIALVGIFFISDRRSEIGIYASLGEKSKNIVVQILCEMLLVTTLAISLSSLTGLILGNSLSDYMLEVQRYTERQQDLGIIADLPVIYKPIEDKMTELTRDVVIDTYDIQPSMEYFATLFIVGECTVLVACGISMIYLMKLKPKEIMM